MGYQSIAERDDCLLAVIRDQFQHRTAVEFGVPQSRIRLFETYDVAANAVSTGLVDAYASVKRAHSGYLAQNENLGLEVVAVPEQEKEPAFGCFGFNKNDLY
jgi:polar amino acid transport system substrate-binding protein